MQMQRPVRQTRHLALTVCLLLAGTAWAGVAYSPEISEYIERREACEHFRQEPWPEGQTVQDKERREFLVSQLQRYCAGTDQAIQELKQKYGNDPAVIDRLDKYEFPIEGRP
jgi:hypothetical protein